MGNASRFGQDAGEAYVVGVGFTGENIKQEAKTTRSRYVDMKSGTVSAVVPFVHKCGSFHEPGDMTLKWSRFDQRRPVMKCRI